MNRLTGAISPRFEGYKDHIQPGARTLQPVGLGKREVPVLVLDLKQIDRTTGYEVAWDHLLKIRWVDQSISYFKLWMSRHEYGAVVLGDLLQLDCIPGAELAEYPAEKEHPKLYGCLRDKLFAPDFRADRATHPKMAQSLEDLYLYSVIAWDCDKCSRNVKYQRFEDRYRALSFDNGYSGDVFRASWDAFQTKALFTPVAGRTISERGQEKISQFLAHPDHVQAQLSAYYTQKQIQQMVKRAQTLQRFPVIVGSAHAFRKLHQQAHAQPHRFFSQVS